MDSNLNAYLAAKAALTLTMTGVFPTGSYEGELIADHIETVAFPGLGTGVGGLGPEDCARAVAKAIQEFAD